MQPPPRAGPHRPQAALSRGRPHTAYNSEPCQRLTTFACLAHERLCDPVAVQRHDRGAVQRRDRQLGAAGVARGRGPSRAAAVRRKPASLASRRAALGRAVSGGHRFAALGPNGRAVVAVGRRVPGALERFGPGRAQGRRARRGSLPAGAQPVAASQGRRLVPAARYRAASVGRTGVESVCRCQRGVFPDLRPHDGAGLGGPPRTGPPADGAPQTASDAAGRRAAAGADLLLPGAGGRSALWPVQQVRRAAACVCRRACG